MTKKRKPEPKIKYASHQPAKAPRLSKFDRLTASVAQDYAHQHTVTINSRRRVLEFEVAEVERSIVALTATLADQRERRARIEAMLRGLATVVEKR